MDLNISAMRKYISERYNGKRWQHRVDHMPDNQVYAIYMSMLSRKDNTKLVNCLIDKLFRAKSKETEKWVYGKYAFLNTPNIGGKDYIVDRYTDLFIEVFPETVCQSSLLFDSKGIELFEDDIVGINFGLTSGKFIVTVKNGCSYFESLDHNSSEISFSNGDIPETIEYIGNAIEDSWALESTYSPYLGGSYSEDDLHQLRKVY